MQLLQQCDCQVWIEALQNSSNFSPRRIAEEAVDFPQAVPTGCIIPFEAHGLLEDQPRLPEMIFLSGQVQPVAPKQQAGRKTLLGYGRKQPLGQPPTCPTRARSSDAPGKATIFGKAAADARAGPCRPSARLRQRRSKTAALSPRPRPQPPRTAPTKKKPRASTSLTSPLDHQGTVSSLVVFLKD